MTKFIPVESVIDYHDQLIQEFGGLSGIRDMGLLLSALEMPRASMFGNDLHETIYDKAAAYLFHIVLNHPFNDANKRTGAFIAYLFLELNGVICNFKDEEYEQLVLDVATGKVKKSYIASFFKDSTKSE